MSTWSRFWAFPITRIIVCLLVFYAVVIAISIPVFPLARLFFRGHPVPGDGELVGSLCEALAVFAAYVVVVRLMERQPLSSAGFAPRGFVTQTAIGYLIGFAMLSVLVQLLSLIGVYRYGTINFHFQPWLFLIAFLGTGIAEETFFRGVVFRLLENRWGTLVGLVGSSLFFGFAHLSNPVQLPLLERLAGPSFITLEAGLLLGAAYIATRRLWLPIGMHWAWDFFEGPFYGANVSGISNKNAFFHASLRGPFWLTGGAFGPEASIPALVVCVVFGLLMLRVAIRSGNWRTADNVKARNAHAVNGASRGPVSQERLAAEDSTSETTDGSDGSL